MQRIEMIAVDTVQRLAWMVRDIISEKKNKFTNPVYSPGLIVADIASPALGERKRSPTPHRAPARHSEAAPERGIPLSAV